MPALSRRRLLRASAASAGALALHPLLGAVPSAAAPTPSRSPEVDAVRHRLLEQTPAYDRPGMPRGVHLSFTEDPRTTRTATWLTTDVAEGTVVQYGVVGGDATAEEVRVADLDRVAEGGSALAPFGDGDVADVVDPIRDVGADVHPGERLVHVHRAVMAGLEPGQRIAYRVGDGRRWSAVHVTGGASVVDGGFRMTHVGDHGCTLASQRVTRAIGERRPDLHLFAGDLSYANGDQRVWDLWAEQVQPLASSVPITASPGNHEAKDFMGQTYRMRLGRPAQDRSYFAQEIGNVLLVSVPAGAFFGDVEGAMEAIQQELLWMELTLARGAARRAAGLIDFIVVTQHFPSYTNHATRGPISADRVIVAEQVLQRYQIDLLLVGHDHMYQRSYPMVFGVPTSGRAITDALGLTPGGSGGGPGLLDQLGVGEAVRGAVPLDGLIPPPETFSNATGYIEVIAGAGGQGMYDFTEVDTFDLRPGSVHPDAPHQRRLPWMAASAREVSFVELDILPGAIELTAYGWDDGYGANTGNGIAGDEVRFDGNDPAVFGTYRAPDRVIDRVRLERKAFAAEVPTAPRPAAEILADLPEAHGHLEYDRAEDCTLHDH